ncbi:hypothetical protein PG997_000851 [Apiospora hydei]|uniref:Uncharacterized protein n=1 Tax=Apiospora hydei TaxID=1337664 RepID=A0ABR1XBZ6_9PEZI
MEEEEVVLVKEELTMKFGVFRLRSREGKQERAYQNEPSNLTVAHTGRATLQQIDSIDDEPLFANSQELALFEKSQLGGDVGADLLT